MTKNSNAIPTGKISRTTITGISAAKAGIKHISFVGKKKLITKYKSQDEQEKHEKEVGQIIYKALGQLRGTALKVAQMLSMEDSLLPKSMRRELAKACHQVLPMNRAHIHKAFIREFKTGYDKLFHKFEAKAFAAASLGQVHDAVSHDGKKLAVKIQYPGIAASIKSDINLIRGLVPAILSNISVPHKKELFKTVFDEIEKRLLEEVDYYFEAKQTKWFAENNCQSSIKIPDVINELSGQRIVTFEKMPGLHIKQWLKTNPSQKDKNRFGQLLFDFFINSTFKYKKMHADPHPGNFLFTDDGTLGIIDFGCVKKFDNSFLTNIRKLFNALIKNQKTENSQLVLEGYKSNKMFSDEIDLQTYKAELEPILKPMQFWLIEPFINETFDFSKKMPFPTKSYNKFMNAVPFFSNFHRDQTYFNRLYTGLMSMLRQMGAVVNTSNQWIGNI